MSARVVQRRPRARVAQNVDSLLDTMANVVGILVVLMAVTQLTVGDAMKRISAWKSEEATSLRDARRKVEDELSALGSADLTRSLELARTQAEIRELKALPDAQAAADTPSVAASVASRRLQVRRLKAEIADKKEHLANLKILLADAAARAQQEGIPVRLPDPRPAPLNTRRYLILCRYGRVFDPHLDQLLKALQHAIDTAPRPLPRYFDAYDVGNEMLRWRILDEIDGRVARLQWRRDDLGETAAQLRSPDAKLRQVLAEHDPRKAYLLFKVWGDSFEVYLEARRLAEAAGYSVGWDPIPDGVPLDFVSGRPPPAPVD